jgi:hypothetical protein
VEEGVEEVEEVRGGGSGGSALRREWRKCGEEAVG